MNPGMKFVVIDFGGNGITHAELVAYAAAQTIQLQQHLALPPPFGWGVGGIVRAAAGPTDSHPDEWPIALLSHADMAGAYGYHEVSPHGRPYDKVFPPLDKQDGVPWTATSSHEAIETSCDPETNEIIQARDGRLYAKENGDPNENGIVVINGVPLSDWVTPAWYTGVGGKANWLGTLSSLEIGPGGYAQTYDPTSGWTQLEHASIRPRAYRLQAVGRSAQRRAKTVLMP